MSNEKIIEIIEKEIKECEEIIMSNMPQNKSYVLGRLDMANLLLWRFKKELEKNED